MNFDYSNGDTNGYTTVVITITNDSELIRGDFNILVPYSDSTRENQANALLALKDYMTTAIKRIDDELAIPNQIPAA